MKTPSTILILSLSTLFWEASGHRPINFQPPGCNRRCPFNYDPVCGTDGKTYANMCTLVVARRCDNVNVRRRHPGECGSTNTNCNPNAGCPFNYAPVCGSDGQTYANDCVFRNAVCRNPGLRKVSDGECGSNNQNCRPSAGCPFNYEPVCGSNGQTYGNLCVFQNAACNIPNLSKVSDGECGSNNQNQNCRPSAGCPFNYEPVCGSNGQTYGNLCVFQNAACNIPNLSKVSDGECGSTNQNCRPSVGCPFNYAPVCGSDGQTYSNLCTFQNAACNVPNLVKVSDGECGSTNSNCRQRVGCPFNLAPVCGSNGQTYPNECVFQNAVCSDPTLTKVSDGECGNGNGNGNGNPNCRPSPICPLNYSPICGSDGKTYGNECDFRNAACNNPRLEQLFSGECGVPNPLCKQTLFCPSTYDPVCGSNGQTYENECVFSNAACSIPDLRMVSDDQCSSQRPNCPQICPANYVPVCGSDGRTYGNACNLGVASCNNPSIRKVSDGECGFMGRIMSFIQNNL